MNYISSADNKNIKLAVKLAEKKVRDREDLFFVEGRNSVEEVLKRPELITSLFLDNSLMDEYQEILSLYNSLEWYGIDSQLMKRICPTETPQGIAAIVKKPHWSLKPIINGDSLLILLDQISDPGNMGTIIRTAWAFNADGILLTRGCVDPFGPKVVRSTMGGILNVPLFTGISEELLTDLKVKQYIFMGADLAGDSSFYSMDFTGRKLVIIGNEAAGISGDLKKSCDYLFKIPIKSSAESLNAAVACAIIMSESYRQRHLS